MWFGCGTALCSLLDGREQQWAEGQGVTGGHWDSIVEDAAGRLWIRSRDVVLISACFRRSVP
ncbi:hypothetical protein SBA3_3690007 [Candidatus Sulfopaludibacter sp. SbA3]|nr:hypothetical protein SBA3_3690007 [Candidatus Sulfopaludibacter sp. SbA3]